MIFKVNASGKKAKIKTIALNAYFGEPFPVAGEWGKSEPIIDNVK